MAFLKSIYVLLLAVPSAASAQSVSSWAPMFSLVDQQVMSTPSYLTAHPDYRWYRAGTAALQDQRYPEAERCFLQAARYADKASQAILAEMHWNGRGVAVNRVMGYVWMDLAAERLYARYVGHRERYWQQLDASEREQAATLGAALYAEYGDQIAKPRLETQLRHQRMQTTGSRTGASLATRSYDGPPPGGPMGGMTSMDQTGFTDPKYWIPSGYWEWQDAAYRSLRKPSVIKGTQETIQLRKPRRPTGGTAG